MLVLPKNHVNSETWQSWVILNCSSRESYLFLATNDKQFFWEYFFSIFLKNLIIKVDLLSLSGPSPANGIYTPDFEKCGRQANQLSQIFRLLLSTMRLLQMPSWSPRMECLLMFTEPFLLSTASSSPSCSHMKARRSFSTWAAFLRQLWETSWAGCTP